MIRETPTLLLVVQVQPCSCVNTNLHTSSLSPTTVICRIFVSQTDFTKRLKCVRQHLVFIHLSSMWKLVTTMFSKLVWHWKVSIWRWLTVLFGWGFQLHSSPLQEPFPVYVTGMSHFSGIPYTVVEIMNFDWLIEYTTCVRPWWFPMQRDMQCFSKHKGDQSMEKNKGKATYSAYAFILLTIEWKTAKAPRQLWTNTENKHHTQWDHRFHNQVMLSPPHSSPTWYSHASVHVQLWSSRCDQHVWDCSMSQHSYTPVTHPQLLA